MALHLQFQLDLDLHLNSSGSKGDVCLKSLRIQIPEHEPCLMTRKERPVEKKGQDKGPKQEQRQKRDQESDDDENAEYVAMSPRYTWSDEQVRAVKQERFGELLWPIVLRSYGITETISRFATYFAFRQSDISQHPERYPHHSLRGLMEWYIEEHLHHFKKGEMWTEDIKRRRLLCRRFQVRRLAWAPEYFEMYMVWSKGCRAGLNRYQKMERFISEFFDK